jgi:UDPglucose 6-dehydrogenase
MNVSIIGTGYVGLVTGVCLAEKGHQVVCVDVDAEKIKKINRGEPPIYELGLEALLKKNLSSRLHATKDLRGSVLSTDATFIAVGTPFVGQCIDLKFIENAARHIGGALKEKTGYHLVVVKSTVVPGTTDDVVRPLLEEASGKSAGKDFGLGMNPEFLTEGQAIHDFMHPDRIVLGGMDERSIDTLADLYVHFDGVEKLRTDNKTAEMIKYSSNCLLATLISFSNEIGNLCATLGGVDVVDVMKGLHLAHYLSPILPSGERVSAPITSFLAAGCGFGGSCLPKDVKALIAHGERAGAPMRLLDAVIDINQKQPMRVVALLRKHFPHLNGLKVVILGVAFKPDTDDVRESPAIPIVKELLGQGVQIKVHDPIAIREAMRHIDDDRVTYSEDLKEVLSEVDAAVLVTRWNEYKQVPALLAVMKSPPLLIDGRRMLDKRSIGKYEGIGL